MKLGIDDSSRCPVIGSLVVAAVAVDDLRRFSGIKIKDSKLATERQRSRMVRKIVKETIRAKAGFSYTRINAQRISQMDLGINLNHLEADAYMKLFNRMNKTGNIKSVIIDNFDRTRENFIEKAKEMGYKEIDWNKFIIEHHADENYKVCSLAGNLAKWISVREYQEIKRRCGDFGSGSPSDKKTRKFIYNAIKNDNKKRLRYIRKSWKTYRREKEKLGY